MVIYPLEAMRWWAPSGRSQRLLWRAPDAMATASRVLQVQASASSLPLAQIQRLERIYPPMPALKITTTNCTRPTLSLADYSIEQYIREHHTEQVSGGEYF